MLKFALAVGVVAALAGTGAYVVVRVATAGPAPETVTVPVREAPKAPDVLHRKYPSFEETWALAQEGQGTSSETGAYDVSFVDSSSHLATRLGLRPGDRIVSINGQPIGGGVDEGQAVFERLRSERRFAVVIERDGERMVLSSQVQ